MGQAAVAAWEHDAAREFLDATGATTRFLTAVHPRDDMHRILAVLGPVTGGPGGHAPYFAYLRSGWEALAALEHVLRRAGRELEEVGAVLEFACGYGRVTRWLVDRLGPRRVTAADVVPEALRFVRRRLGVRTVRSRYDPEEIRFPGRYALIFVASLFSHLPRHRFGAWLRRLFEALQPEGLLVFSTHGLELVPSDAQIREAFAFVPRSESPRLPREEYGLAFVAPAAVRRFAAGAGIPHLYGCERELWAVQDLYVASPQPLPGLEQWVRAPIVRGAIDEVLAGPDGRLELRGWAADFSTGSAPAAVLVRANEIAAFAEQGFPRPDVGPALSRPDFGPTGWRVTLPVGSRRPLLLMAWGRTEGGPLLPFAARHLATPRS